MTTTRRHTHRARALGARIQTRYGRATAPIYDALNRRVFPVIVAYATHPLIILVTMLLLLPLILDASNTALALVLGNYTNVVSATVSSIVLATSMTHHQENRRRHDEHNRQLSDLQRKHDALAERLAAHDGDDTTA